MGKIFALLFCTAISTPAYAQNSTGLIPDWWVETEKSPIDGSDMVFVSATGVGVIPGQLDIFPTLLVLACRETQTHIWVDFGDGFSFGTESARVTYLIDGGAAKNMAVSPSGSALGLWDSTSAIPFIKSMFGADTLLVRAMPQASNLVEAEFIIPGLKQAVKPLRKACHW